MSKRLRWRLFLIFLVVVGMVAGYVAMGYSNARREWIGPGKPPLREALKKGIKLGLDLRGGIHLVLQVNTIDAVKAERDDAAEQLQTQAREQGITIGPVEFPGDHSFTVAVTPQTDERKLDETAKRFLPDWNATTAGGKWVFTLKDLARRAIEDNAVAQAVETIRNRIDEFGVAEPLIARQGTDRILVQLPGIDDPKRVKDLIKNTAFLELKLVQGGPTSDRAALLAPHGGQVPANMEIVEGAVVAGQREQVYYLVLKSAVITGRDLKNARPTQRQLGGNAVSFFLNAAGAEKFAAATGANVGKQLAIILDKRVKSSPTINEQIHDQGEITGSFTPEEANDLALVLRAGALPAGLTYLEERTVGPSLGLDSIKKGITASVTGALFVFVAVVLYYRLSGLNAVLALILNAIMLLGAMALFNATLTLPGIAGFILTIGMAVDSNVLIFERIREELRAGRAPKTAIDNGFSKAFATIIDTHLTVIISAIFLFQFGTGPVKGFAVTLILGLLISVFTAVFVSHTIFELMYGRRQHIDALSI
ncbi:MAG TPA: protein translocase subunit SecD [Thermoanaerobaculia bacterium]|nr:protein translocase subunit SecD [Thermoanaerobaculia bacterium]